MNSCLIQDNGTQSDCSNLFESIHPAFTILQACVAIAVIVLGIPLNLLLTVALVKFHRLMDEGFILCISVFIANMIVSLVIGINIFSSSATRSWPLGYFGCQLIGFVSFVAIVARWLTLGMLSIDRFCRMFLPFCYSRHSKIVLKVLLIFPWVVVLPISILSLWKIYTKYDFTIILPGCFYQTNCNGSVVCAFYVPTLSLLLLASGSVLPIVIYIILYIKSRRLLRATHTPHVPSNQPTAYERQKKATKTFALMVITFSIYSATLLLSGVINRIPAIKDITGLFFLVFDITLLYLVTDFLLIWKNKHGKEVIKKLINTLLGKQVCISDTVISAPARAASQEQMSFSSTAPVPTSGQDQPATCTTNPAPQPASGQDQADTTNPAPEPVSSHDQPVNPAPEPASVQD